MIPTSFLKNLVTGDEPWLLFKNVKKIPKRHSNEICFWMKNNGEHNSSEFLASTKKKTIQQVGIQFNRPRKKEQNRFLAYYRMSSRKICYQ